MKKTMATNAVVIDATAEKKFLNENEATVLCVLLAQDSEVLNINEKKTLESQYGDKEFFPLLNNLISAKWIASCSEKGFVIIDDGYSLSKYYIPAILPEISEDVLRYFEKKSGEKLRQLDSIYRQAETIVEIIKDFDEDEMEELRSKLSYNDFYDGYDFDDEDDEDYDY